MVYRLIAPDWLLTEQPQLPKAREGEFTSKQIQELNQLGYNAYWLPNYPSVYNKGTTVDGTHIDVFNYVFADMDLKDNFWTSKEEFMSCMKELGPEPTFVVDSGGGLHIYWAVSDLDPMSFLRLGRRIARHYHTDDRTQKIYQLMRMPGTFNMKLKENPRHCDILFESQRVYSADELDSALPPISSEDEAYCQQHFAKTYRSKENIKVEDTIPVKFKKLLRSNQEVKDIWAGNVDDRSKGDYRLGHLMYAEGFTREEAMSVLVNTAKASNRAPIHRIGYAEGIVEKVWGYEDQEDFDPDDLSQSVQQILDGAKGAIQGQRIRCYSWIDNTKTGFRLGHVVGVVAGVKTGKTVLNLNMAKGFVQYNPDMDHIFVALEQPAQEIAYLWRKLCRDEPQLWKRLRVISNYNADGTHRQLSQDDIVEYVVQYQKKTGRKVGCVMIDHIGALKQSGPDRFKPIEDLCHSMKPAAIRTNTLWVMQSHAPREKAGYGDLELNQDAAYGTQRFEAYCDVVITMWQPLKRAYNNAKCPKVTAFKFAAMRHKEEGDVIQENIRYRMTFDPSTGTLREMTQDEETSFDFFNRTCTSIRKQDKKTELLTYTSAKTNAETNNRQDPPAA